MGRVGQDPIKDIAEQVADCFAEQGYAFVEDDKVVALANALQSFLEVAGIPGREAPVRRVPVAVGPTPRFV